MKNDGKLFCKPCHTIRTSWLIRKLNQSTPVVPLKPIPVVGEPFNQASLIAWVLFPREKQENKYLLTIMWVSTRFLEPMPLWNIKAKNIIKLLIKFFTLVGLPKMVQSNQGSHFMARVFKQVLYQLGIRQNISSAYHPESQEALERFIKPLKTCCIHTVLSKKRIGMREYQCCCLWSENQYRNP